MPNDVAPSQRPAFQVIADRGSCCGYGVCAEICPEIYKLDEAGLVVLASDLVPPELEEKAREGAESCPQGALRLEPVDA